MRVRLVLIGAALAVGLLVAGCSSDNETSTGGTTTLPEPPVNSVVTTVPSGITPLVNVATNPSSNRSAGVGGSGGGGAERAAWATLSASRG